MYLRELNNNNACFFFFFLNETFYNKTLFKKSIYLNLLLLIYPEIFF